MKRSFHTKALWDLREQPGVPSAAWDLLARVASAVAELDAANLVLGGSLARLQGDSLSDIDLEAICDDEPARCETRECINTVLRDAGPILSCFPATHIGLPHLWIHSIEVEGSLLKVDVHYALNATEPSAPGGVELVGAGGIEHLLAVSEPADLLPPTEFFADLHSKFSGWIWYTHTKILRGELWEADDSISVMRTRALLPVLQVVRGLPLEGCRRLEARLTPEDLEQLRRTRACTLDSDSLHEALAAIVSMFDRLMPALVLRLGQDFRVADLARIREFSRS